MSSEGYNPDEDEKLSEKQKELVKKVLTDENGKPDVVISVERKEETDKDRERDAFWNEAVSDIQSAYDALNKPFDASKIKTKEDIENAFREIADLREQKKPTQASKEEFDRACEHLGRNSGDYNEPTGDRDIQALKESCRDIPLDMLEYSSEKEMKELLDAIANDTNDPRQKEAEKLRMKLLRHSVNRDQSIELDSTLTEALKGKARWKIKKREDDD